MFKRLNVWITHSSSITMPQNSFNQSIITSAYPAGVFPGTPPRSTALASGQPPYATHYAARCTLFAGSYNIEVVALYRLTDGVMTTTIGRDDYPTFGYQIGGTNPSFYQLDYVNPGHVEGGRRAVDSSFQDRYTGEPSIVNEIGIPLNAYNAPPVFPLPTPSAKLNSPLLANTFETPYNPPVSNYSESWKGAAIVGGASLENFSPI